MADGSFSSMEEDFLGFYCLDEPGKVNLYGSYMSEKFATLMIILGRCENQNCKSK